MPTFYPRPGGSLSSRLAGTLDSALTVPQPLYEISDAGLLVLTGAVQQHIVRDAGGL